MRHNAKKFGLLLGVLMLTLLLAGVAAVVPGPVSAQDDSPGEPIQDTSRFSGEGSSGGEPVIPPSGAPVEKILFEQLPTPPDQGWSFYTSNNDTTYDYLCMDDFWELTEDIGDIHWWGLCLYWDSGWYECDPAGMEFQIIFYQDTGGAPGPAVATFSNVSPTFAYYGTYSGFPAYRFDVADLGMPVSLTQGWVSIQSTYSPSGCWFLWANSPTGNLNAYQQNGEGYLYDNLAFALTDRGLEFGDAPEGALAYPSTGVIGAFPTCRNVTIAGWVQHNNFGTWFGPAFDMERDGNAGLCPGFAPYNNDECFDDGDAGLVMPGAYTIRSGNVAPCGSLDSACEYSICLQDSYGDGWNGGYVDVFVNGNPAYTGLTLAGGYGPECHPIPVGNGDEITVHYTGGGWPYENAYYIYDSNGVLVRSEEGIYPDGPGDVPPGELYAAGCASGGMAVASLGSPCEWAQWGSAIDILIHNWMPNHEPYLPAYVNVLIDWNGDGQWQNDPTTGCSGNMTPEHVLVNFLVPPQYDGTLSDLNPPSFQIGPNEGYVWARFSITEQAVRPDWNGEGEFEDGETEDYLLRVYVPPPVGGEAYPVDKASLVAPWIAVAVVLAGGSSWYLLRRRRA